MEYLSLEEFLQILNSKQHVTTFLICDIKNFLFQVLDQLSVTRQSEDEFWNCVKARLNNIYSKTLINIFTDIIKNNNFASYFCRSLTFYFCISYKRHIGEKFNSKIGCRKLNITTRLIAERQIKFSRQPSQDRKTLMYCLCTRMVVSIFSTAVCQQG